MRLRVRVRVRGRVVVAPGHRARGEARPRSTVAPVDILVALPRAPGEIWGIYGEM